MRRLSRVIRFILEVVTLYLAVDAFMRLLRRLFPFPVPPTLNPLLDAPVREISQPRHITLERIGLMPGMKALELGPGLGYYTIEAARLIGPEGTLSAVDVQPRMVASVQEKAREAGLENVEARVADGKRLPYPSGTFDLAFLVSVLGEIPDKGRVLRELRRVLKPNGRLSITETMPDSNYMLMPEVVGWAQTVGFELVEQQGNAFLYTLNFRSLLGP